MQHTNEEIEATKADEKHQCKIPVGCKNEYAAQVIRSR